MANRSYIVDELEKLIEICRDGQQGYREGAEHARDPQLKALFNEVSLERAKFAGDLESEAVRWGKADVDRSGTPLGALHRGWTSLKASLGGGDDAILASMETGDKAAMEEYDRVYPRQPNARRHSRHRAQPSAGACRDAGPYSGAAPPPQSRMTPADSAWEALIGSKCVLTW